MYTHKMNKATFAELERHYKYEPNKRYTLSSIDLLHAESFIRKLPVFSLEEINKHSDGYGRNAICKEYAKLELYKKEKSAIIKEYYFTDEMTERLKDLFYEFFEVSGNFMKTITLK